MAELQQYKAPSMLNKALQIMQLRQGMEGRQNAAVAAQAKTEFDQKKFQYKKRLQALEYAGRGTRSLQSEQDRLTLIGNLNSVFGQEAGQLYNQIFPKFSEAGRDLTLSFLTKTENKASGELSQIEMDALSLGLIASEDMDPEDAKRLRDYRHTQKLELSRTQGSERERLAKNREARALETKKAAEERAKAATIEREIRAARRKAADTERANLEKTTKSETLIIGNMENPMVKPHIKSFNRYTDGTYFYHWDENAKAAKQITLPVWPPPPAKGGEQVTMKDVRKSAIKKYGKFNEKTLKRVLNYIGIWVD